MAEVFLFIRSPAGAAIVSSFEVADIEIFLPIKMVSSTPSYLMNFVPNFIGFFISIYFDDHIQIPFGNPKIYWFLYRIINILLICKLKIIYIYIYINLCNIQGPYNSYSANIRLFQCYLSIIFIFFIQCRWCNPYIEIYFHNKTICNKFIPIIVNLIQEYSYNYEHIWQIRITKNSSDSSSWNRSKNFL